MEVKGKSIGEIQVGDEISASRKVPMDQMDRYAEASGDYNPIHMDEDIAKASGFRERIVHGLCTMAYCSKMFTDWAEDPMRLKRLKVRFTDPLYRGDIFTVKAKVTSKDENVIKFDFEGGNQDGARIITKGEAEISSN
jgi:acyl dehydratase